MTDIIEVPAVERRALLREFENSCYAYQCGACGACGKVYHTQAMPHYKGCPTTVEGVLYTRYVSGKLAVFDAQPLVAPAPLPLATLRAACRRAKPLAPGKRIRYLHLAIPVGPVTRKRGRVIGMRMSVDRLFSGAVVSTEAGRTVLQVRADAVEAYLETVRLWQRRIRRSRHTAQAA